MIGRLTVRSAYTTCSDRVPRLLIRRRLYRKQLPLAVELERPAVCRIWALCGAGGVDAPICMTRNCCYHPPTQFERRDAVVAITSIIVRGSRAAALGLPEQTLYRLGSYVVFAGKNGSGKSRLLRYVSEIINFAKSVDKEKYKAQLEGMRSQSATYRARPEMIQNMEQLEILLSDVGGVVSDGPHGHAVSFLPSSGDLANPDDMARSTRETHASNLKQGDATHWNSSVLAYIAKLQDEWREATHQHSTHQQADIDRAIERYESLNEAVEQFFGQRLERGLDGTLTMYGKNIARAELSSGQKIALQLIAALHAQADELGPSVLVLDEPENHLHPAALVHLLSRIRKNAPDVQIWIATHSIPLLAYINSIQPSAIWGVDDGKAEFAGRKAEDVIKSLLGNDENIGHLTSFLSLPYHLASNNYAYQCLLPPEVVYTGQADSQLQQIRRSLNDLRGSDALKVVDFGAGKGRLVEALASDDDEGTLFDYIAFDPCSDDAAVCQDAIKRKYGSSEGRYFNDDEALIASRGASWADCVVMTNVLHEVPVEDWLRLFSPSGLISRILKSGGYVLIVEDQRIPVGEMAHQNGFLLMSTNELMEFFAITADDRAAGNFRASDDRDGRLTAHLVSKHLFQRVTAGSRRAAVEAIRNLAIRNIVKLRVAEKSYANGLLHGLWAQQLANATLALEQI